MSPAKFKQIRDKLGLTQEELSQVLGVKGYKPISHYETGFRTPSLTIQAVMSYLESLSDKEAVDVSRELRRFVIKLQKPPKVNKR